MGRLVTLIAAICIAICGLVANPESVLSGQKSDAPATAISLTKTHSGSSSDGRATPGGLPLYKLNSAVAFRWANSVAVEAGGEFDRDCAAKLKRLIQTKAHKQVVSSDGNPDLVLRDVNLRHEEDIPAPYRVDCGDNGFYVECRDNTGASLGAGVYQAGTHDPSEHLKAMWAWELFNPKTGRRVGYFVESKQKAKKIMKELGYK